MTAAEIQLNVVAQSLQAISEVVASLAKTLPEQQPPNVTFLDPIEERHLTTTEASRILKCSSNTLAVWRMRGIGPNYISMGSGRRKTIRYTKSDIDAFVKANKKTH